VIPFFTTVLMGGSLMRSLAGPIFGCSGNLGGVFATTPLGGFALTGGECAWGEEVCFEGAGPFLG